MEPYFENEWGRLYHGDCIETMDRLDKGSINCCVTSPPYFGLRDYGVDGQIGLEQTPDEYVSKLVDVFRSVREVLTDDGTLWLNLGDSYAANRGYQVEQTKGGPKHGPAQGVNGRGQKAIDYGLKPKDLIGIPWRVAFALQADGWYLRQDIIWHKPNPMPESVKDRCTKAHEYIFLLSKSPKYWFDHEVIKEPCTSTNPKIPWRDREYGTGQGVGERNGEGSNKRGTSRQPCGNPDDGMRNRRSVWFVSTKPFKDAHFATFPPDLIEPCILAGCPIGGTVLDPFMGAGTTSVVSQKWGRRWVGIELNREYCEIAVKRLQNKDMIFRPTPKAESREDKDAQKEYQMDLFSQVVMN